MQKKTAMQKLPVKTYVYPITQYAFTETTH